MGNRKSIRERRRKLSVNEVKSTLDRKSIPIVAWYVLSNESYINLVIRDVFPTAKMSEAHLMVS